MAYAWQRVPAQSSFEAARKQPLTFDSWVLVLYDDPSRPSSEQPKTTAWFSGPEEALQFLEERLLALWYPPEESAGRDLVAAHLAKLRGARKLKIKELETWRRSFNDLARAKGQILWLGTFDDLQRGEASAAEVGADLDFWLSENGIELSELDLDEPRHQKLVAEFLVDIGA
jgi:hypothetical protein